MGYQTKEVYERLKKHIAISAIFFITTFIVIVKTYTYLRH